VTGSSIGIIALTQRAWSDRYMSEANIVLRLARRHPVVWVTPAHHWRDTFSRLLSRTPAFLRVADALTIYTPPAYLPSTYRPAALRRWLRARRLARARWYLLRQGCERIVLYVWRPEYADALELVSHDASVYHIVDEYSFSPDDPPTSEQEARLIEAVDRLIVHSPGLQEKKGRADGMSFIPNGVDYEACASVSAEPSDLAAIPHPRVGYCGYLKRQMDWDLLTRLIDRHPDYSWVFVGALRHRDLSDLIEDLARRTNVYFLGGKTSEELMRYPQHFDVCIMPYSQDNYTRYIFPLKLHEYLASGTPTIGTPIRSLLEYEDVVLLADGVEEWTQALELAIDPASSAPEMVQSRRRVARDHDWETLADQIDVLIREAVA